MNIPDILDKIGATRALVIGDPCLDEIVYGRVDMIAKEAPVPAIVMDEVQYAPGQAANVAANLASLGIKTVLAGLIGGDEAGEKLKAALDAKRVRYSLTESEGRPPPAASNTPAANRSGTSSRYSTPTPNRESRTKQPPNCCCYRSPKNGT